MSDSADPSNSDLAPGTISWIDLTVDGADDVRDFYQELVGWSSQPVPVDDHNDFCMNASNGDTVAGICHSKGSNAGIPPVWMVYINVSDANAAVAKCEALGGEVIQPPRQAGQGQCAILRDPYGTVFGIYQAGS